MKAELLVCLFFVFWLMSCGFGQAGNRKLEEVEITIFAAASLADAFNELSVVFEADNPGVQVVLNFAGSSQLAAQLSEGVAADIFASANPVQMRAVIEVGRIEVGTERLFASNRLTVVVPEDNPAGISAFKDLTRSGVQLVLAVEGVPVRNYTDEILGRMPVGFQEKFYSNLVSEEDNVRQVLAKVALGEADAGIVYTSDVTPDIANQVRHIAIPEAQNIIAAYLIAPLADSPQPELAQSFMDFVLSEEGQNILSRWGFGPPPGN